MKLIDYVLKHDLRVPKLAINAELVDMTVEEYILAFYCPSGFECLKRSPYHAPLKPHPNNIYTCMYDSGGSDPACIGCWNREVWIPKGDNE